MHPYLAGAEPLTVATCRASRSPRGARQGPPGPRRSRGNCSIHPLPPSLAYASAGPRPIVYNPHILAAPAAEV